VSGKAGELQTDAVSAVATLLFGVARIVGRGRSGLLSADQNGDATAMGIVGHYRCAQSQHHSAKREYGKHERLHVQRSPGSLEIVTAVAD
jgi:hypothetical protein